MLFIPYPYQVVQFILHIDQFVLEIFWDQTNVWEIISFPPQVRGMRTVLVLGGKIEEQYGEDFFVLGHIH